MHFKAKLFIYYPLHLDEINNVENIVKILAFTIDQMKKIDEAFDCP